MLQPLRNVTLDGAYFCAFPSDATDLPQAFGPFVDGISHVERVARLRSLRALVPHHCGDRLNGIEFGAHLARAERDPSALPAAFAAFRRLPSIYRHSLLEEYTTLD